MINIAIFASPLPMYVICVYIRVHLLFKLLADIEIFNPYIYQQLSSQNKGALLYNYNIIIRKFITLIQCNYLNGSKFKFLQLS